MRSTKSLQKSAVISLTSLALKQGLISALLILTALLTIFAAEVVVRLQVVLGDLSAAVSGAADGALLASLERLVAAKALAVHVANGLAAVALFGAAGFAILGDASRLTRLITFAVVLALLVRAYFWSVA